MDTSEQPTVWPPPPTVAPPEAEKAKPFKLKLPLPDWGRYWYKSSLWFFSAWYIIRGFCEVDHLQTPRWCSFPAALAAWFVVGGLMTAWKFRPKNKR